jgi:hypothetical protein
MLHRHATHILYLDTEEESKREKELRAQSMASKVDVDINEEGHVHGLVV